MVWKRECRNGSCIAVNEKRGKWMPWSEFVKLKRNRKRIKDTVTGFLQKYPERLAKSYAVEWAVAAFGIPPVFGTAVHVFIETLR